MVMEMGFVILVRGLMTIASLQVKLEGAITV